jgi:DNA invertase Pin-like site-specific DNA recombinase
MSTELQLKGDSRRRQLEASRAYAEANGLELAEGAELEDIGVSAFKGANVREGAHGQFLEAVKAGSVKPGSYLIVESLDRLSREQVLTAQSLFLSIIQAGIHLVTLADNRVYRAGMTDLADLIMSLVIMSRAHEESQTKSHRIAAAWKNKRAKAISRQPMTKWCPAWLKLSPDRAGYEPIPERVGIVRQIFRDTASGIGIYSIASRLNKAAVDTFGSPNGWHQSYVAKILANRGVLGEFQPHIRVDGKRVPDGEAIAGYFPSIIDEELFYQAQHAKSQRRGVGAGRKGAAFSNLFSGLARCIYCHLSVLFENKGSGPKGGTYLICDGARRQLGCPSLRWRYREFEASFLAFVQELDIESIVNGNTATDTKQRLEAELASLQGELSSVGDLRDKTYALLSVGGSSVDYVSGKLNELTDKHAELTRRVAVKTAEQQELLSRETRYQRSTQEIGRLVGQLQSPATEELFKLRAQVSSQLKSLVETLLIAPLGDRPRMRKSIDRLKDSTIEGEVDDVIAYMEQQAAHPDQSRRYFAVGFRDGNVRIVFPSDDDPLRYQQQIVGKERLSLIGAEGQTMDLGENGIPIEALLE